MKCFRVEALDFDPPIIQYIEAESAGKARFKMAYDAYDAGFYRKVGDALKRMKVNVVKEEKTPG